MRMRSLSLLFSLLTIAAFGVAGGRACAAGTFAVAATNVTMPSSGLGSSQFTVTSPPLTGTLFVSCTIAGPVDPTTKVPTCSGGPLVSIPVKAGQTVTGAIPFYPYGVIVPAALGRVPHGLTGAPAGGLALAGVLVLGLGLRRRNWRWFVPMLLAVVVASAAGGCGGGSNAMMPGTYQYKISVVNSSSNGGAPTYLATTTISVTVP